MESNKDEALRCFGIAEKYFNADNLVSARKFCLKSISLFKTAQAETLLGRIDAAESNTSSPSSSSTSSSSDVPRASATEEHPSAAGMKHRHHPAPQAASSTSSSSATTANGNSKKRDYTPQQHEVVKRVRACKVTEYYEILALNRDCEEADVKKAYRKLALALHPDKNGAPGADEAFKMVSKAFQILSDPQKRAAYDRSGGDPEDRFGGGSQADFGSFFGPGGGRTAATFDGEISPEELFNMFFGGGGGFAGPGTAFSFGNGGPGVFTASFGPGGFSARRAGGGAAQENTPRSLLIQLLPLIILFGFSLLSALPNLFSTPPIPDPHFSFHNTARYNAQRQTVGLGVQYFVNPGEFQKHPVIGAELAREGNKVTSSAAARGPALKKFEDKVEHVYTQDLYLRCQRGLDRKNRLKENEIGLFGFGTDWAKVKKIEEEPIEECDKLKSLGIL